MLLPRRNNEVKFVQAHGKTLNVKRIKDGTYYARVRGQEEARLGTEEQITEDVDYFMEHGSLPATEGLGGSMRRSIPRIGTKVRFEPNAASLMLYTHHPDKGETGRVTTVSVGSRRIHYMPGPGGGLLYVRWDKSDQILGVSLLDVERV